MPHPTRWLPLALLALALALSTRADVPGTATFVGQAPPPRQGLPPGVVDESLLVGPKGQLMNVVVYVKDGAKLGGRVPEQPAVLDIQNTTLVPHVLPVMVGQQLQARNLDNVLHVVNGLGKINKPVEAPLQVRGQVVNLPAGATAVETYTIRCAVHPWMKAWVVVLDHPYFAVTDPNGQFALPNLKPGKYTLIAWQEKLGTREAQIEIAPSGTPTKPIQFPFYPKPKP